MDRMLEPETVEGEISLVIEYEPGDIFIPDTRVEEVLYIEQAGTESSSKTNRGTEFFKVKTVDMIGASQWTVFRGQKLVKVSILHEEWLDAYHRREHTILPGDSLECDFEETISYDDALNELERRLVIIRVIRVVTPPKQAGLF